MRVRITIRERSVSLCALAYVVLETHITHELGLAQRRLDVWLDQPKVIAILNLIQVQHFHVTDYYRRGFRWEGVTHTHTSSSFRLVTGAAPTPTWRLWPLQAQT